MITVKIFTLGMGKIIEGIESATFDWENQEMEVLPGHAELFAAIVTGNLTMKKKEESSQVDLNNAVINFENSTNILTIFQ